MKFNEMKYKRLDVNEMENSLKQPLEKFKVADNYETAKEAFLEMDKAQTHIHTYATLAQIHHDIDTRDDFYTKENEFWMETLPQLQPYSASFTKALLHSPFRAEFEKDFGAILFVNAEIEEKAFDPILVEDLKKENKLAQEYENLLASAQVDFEGEKYTLSQMTPFMNDADDDRRLQAWVAEGRWYKEHQPEMDRIYDELVHLRDSMG